MKHTQRTDNPFPYSDSNKRYHTYDYAMRRQFGGKVAKLPLDAGFTCPNIDGRCGTGGCIYCSPRGSGDFAMTPDVSITEQIRSARERLSAKWQTDRCIAYFQAHTNTYAPVPVLRSRYEEALASRGVVGLAVATRADCLPDETVALLAELAERTALTVELGLQSSSDETAKRINRGHDFATFCDGVRRLRAASERIGICVHVIFGLPGETKADMLRTVEDTVALSPDQIKIHLLHCLRGTELGDMYERGEYVPMAREAYIETVVEALERIPPRVVIGRLTGDGMADDLLAPLWSKRKVSVLNDIDKMLFFRQTWQGKHAFVQKK